MARTQITHYPVANGDTSLIELECGTSILIDCNITKASSDGGEPESYDVVGDLRGRLRAVGGCLHIDAFILSHPDEDHCRGFADTFWLGDPSGCETRDGEEPPILIDELWFSPRVFTPHQDDLCDDAAAFKEEAERRVRLYRTSPDEAAVAGNRLRVIGWSDDPQFDGLESILSVAGTSVNVLNGKLHDAFAFFVLAPIKADTDSECAERNDTSVVLRAEFDLPNAADPAVVYFGGDAGCAVWERIWDQNHADAPQWDALLAPHHCSWSFFAESSSDDRATPSSKVLRFLGHHHAGAKVVASSKAIKDDDDNPPHSAAAAQYRKAVGAENFLCTADHAGDEPAPLVLEVTSQGLRKSSRSARRLTAPAIRKTVSEPRRYG